MAPDVAARLRADTVTFHRQGGTCLKCLFRIAVVSWASALHEFLVVRQSQGSHEAGRHYCAAIKVSFRGVRSA